MQPGTSGSIALTVREETGVSRDSEAVRSGLPFPEGALASADHVRLLDPAGNEVPLDAEPLSFWPDGSVRWLLLNFSASVGANDAAVYRLEHGPQVVRSVRGGLIIRDSAEAFEIVNRRIRFSIPKGRFAPMSGLSLRSDGRWRQVDGCRLDLVITDWAERVFRASSEQADYSVRIEEWGESHAVFLMRGSLAGKTGELLRYEMRLFCGADSDLIRLAVTLQNREREEWTLLRSAALVTTIADAEQAVFGGEHGPAVIALGDGEAGLLQRGPTARAADQPFECEISGPGEVVREVSKAPGWAEISDGEVAVACVCRRFWQQHPKGFTAARGSLELGLVSNGSGLFPWHQGMDKTHEVAIWPHELADARSAGHEAAAFEHPLFATADPEWYCSSRTLKELSPADPSLFPRYEALLAAAFRGLAHHRERCREYGMVDFGDHTEDSGHWENLEYDTTYCLYTLFARSGQREYLEWANDAAAHQMDVDIAHYLPSDPDCQGSACKHSPCHFAAYGRLDHVCIQGLCLSYLITGNRRALEVARGVADFLTRGIRRGINSAIERRYGWPMIGLRAFHEATGEADYLEAIKDCAAQVMAKAHPTRGTWLREWGKDESGRTLLGSKVFMVAMLLEGMIDYHELTGDENAADFIVKSARAICNEGWVEKDRSFYYTPELGIRDKGRPTDLREPAVLLYAYKLCGDRDLLSKAARHLDHGLDVMASCLVRDNDGLDVYPTNAKGFGILTRSTPRAVAMLRELGAWRDDGPAV